MPGTSTDDATRYVICHDQHTQEGDVLAFGVYDITECVLASGEASKLHAGGHETLNMRQWMDGEQWRVQSQSNAESSTSHAAAAHGGKYTDPSGMEAGVRLFIEV